MSLVPLLLSLIVVALVSVRAQYAKIGRDRYSLKFDTADGISREEKGILRNPGTPDEEWAVVGEFSWPDPDGNMHRTKFTAGKNGYNAVEEPFVAKKVAPLTKPGLSVKAALTG